MKKLLYIIVNKFEKKYPETYKNKLTALATGLFGLLGFLGFYNILGLTAMGLAVVLFVYPENIMDN